MICPYCGSNVNNDDTICGSCAREIGGTSPETHKSCPYCAEQIKKEAIVCRFCKKKLPGVSKRIKRYRPKLKKGITSVHAYDLASLVGVLGDSYKKIPGQINAETKKSVELILDQFMQENVFSYSAFRLRVPKETIKKMVLETNGFIQGWCYVCSAVGVEVGYGNISITDSRRYVEKCNKPLFIYLDGYTKFMLEHGIIDNDQCQSLANQMTILIDERANILLTSGINHYHETESLYEKESISVLTMELMQIDLSVTGD